jgi:hypothetical protein
VVSFPSGFPIKTLWTLLLSPYMLHAPSIPFFSIRSPEQYWDTICCYETYVRSPNILQSSGNLEQTACYRDLYINCAMLEQWAVWWTQLTYGMPQCCCCCCTSHRTTQQEPSNNIKYETDLISVTRTRHGAVGRGIRPYVLHSCYAMILQFCLLPFQLDSAKSRLVREEFFCFMFVNLHPCIIL